MANESPKIDPMVGMPPKEEGHSSPVDSFYYMANLSPAKREKIQAERERADLVEQRDLLRSELEQARSRIDVVQDQAGSRNDALQATIQSLQLENAKLQAETARLKESTDIGKVISIITALCLVFGSSLISSDSAKGVLFYVGWILVIGGIVFQFVTPIFVPLVCRFFPRLLS